MKGILVALGWVDGREAAARVIDGTLDDLLIASPQGAGYPPETILRGTLGRPAKGMGGVFVNLPDGATGFLKQTKGLRPGQSILVQISGQAEPGKALPLTTRLLFKGRHAILTPNAPGMNISRGIKEVATRERLAALAQHAMAGAQDTHGLILRTAATLAQESALSTEIAELRKQADHVFAAAEGPPELLLRAPGPHAQALRDWSVPAANTMAEGPDAFADHGIDAMIDALLDPHTALPGGAGMTIELTRALVAVDVNTGADMSPAAGLKANLAAARALPRQLRLRGLGGQITVDFAPIPKRDRQILEQSLRAAFRHEPGETTLAGWTPLGNFELHRKRDRRPIAHLLGS